MKPRKRVVEDYDEVLDVLARCTTVRIGMFDGTRPYVVPVSFGMEVKEGLPVVYFHCGKRTLPGFWGAGATHGVRNIGPRTKARLQ